MSRNYKDVVGNALAYPGGYAVFGDDPAAGGMSAGPMVGPGGMPGLMMGPGFGPGFGFGFGPAGYGWPGWCGAPLAGFDDHFKNRWLKSIAVGPVCGPTETEALVGSDFPVDGLVKKGAAVTVRYIPQIPLFKAYRLGVPSDIASAFVLTSLQGANQNLLAGSGAIPALALSEVARGNWLNGVSVVGNQPLIATFVNISGQDSPFFSWVAGVGVAGGGWGIFGGPHAQ